MDELNEDIFNIMDEEPQPSRGALLLAKPLLNDPVFGRSVIVMVDHDSKGSMGVIVNRLSGYTLRDALPQMETEEDVPLFLGGPVHPQVLFFLHTLPQEVIPQSVQLSRGLYLGGDIAAMEEYVRSGQPVNGRVKFILGYSGWSAGQLNHEVKAHDWAVMKNTLESSALMADCEEHLWRDIVAKAGPRYRRWLLCPSDANVN